MQDDGDYDCIIDSNLCMYSKIFLRKYIFSQMAKARLMHLWISFVRSQENERLEPKQIKCSQFLSCSPLIEKLRASRDSALRTCLRCINNKAGTEVSLKDDIKTMSKSVSCKAMKGCIIGKPKGRNQCRGSLSSGLKMSQVEETTIKTILNSNVIRLLEVKVRYKSHSNQEQVEEDWGYNTTFIHFHINRKT